MERHSGHLERLPLDVISTEPWASELLEKKCLYKLGWIGVKG